MTRVAEPLTRGAEQRQEYRLRAFRRFGLLIKSLLAQIRDGALVAAREAVGALGGAGQRGGCSPGGGGMFWKRVQKREMFSFMEAAPFFPLLGKGGAPVQQG